MTEDNNKKEDKIGEYVVPVDPMEYLNCDGCQ